MVFFRGLAQHRERTTFALADGAEFFEATWRDRQDVAFLRLVAPDLARRHAGFLRRRGTQFAAAAFAAAVHQYRQRVRQAAGADVEDRQDRIRLAELPAAVDDFLRTPLHFGVAALLRIEVEVSRVGAGVHR